MIVTLIVRNLKVYIRDKGMVFFSFLGVLIIIVLYILFLGEAIEKEVANLIDGRMLVDTYIMSGVLCVSTMTTTLGAYGILIDDAVSHRNKDFLASPFDSYELDCGYLFSAMIIGFGISLITLMIAVCYIVSRGGSMFPLGTMMKLIYVLLISIVCSGSISYVCMRFVKSHGAYSGMNVVVGTLIGFVTGVYIPIGSLSPSMQWIVKLFPLSHSGVLLRSLMMEPAVEHSFQGASIQTVEQFQTQMGITFYYGSEKASSLQHVMVLLLISGLFFVLGGVRKRKK